MTCTYHQASRYHFHGAIYSEGGALTYILACHFTTKDVVQVVAFPIIPKSSDLTSPAPVVVFTPEYANINDKSIGPKSWNKHVAYPDQFRLIHDVKILTGTNGELDMLLVSGKEGVVLLWYDVKEKKFKWNIVGKGIPDPNDAKVKYWGAGSVDVCRVGDDDVGYIATCEVCSIPPMFSNAHEI